MIFLPTDVPGAVLVDLERHEDARGHFARTWCAREFGTAGLSDRLVQASVSFNHRRGTLRGLHYQAPPHEEDKLVRCTAGAIWDVIVDLRPDSPTYLRHVAVELRAATGRALYIPAGVAHGFQTLEDGCEVFYQMSEFYAPDASRGVRWNDPLLGINWPIADPILHPRDAGYADYRPVA